MIKRKKNFALHCENEEEFEKYVTARRKPVIEGDGEWGDDPEIRAMEELFDRKIEIFSNKYSAKEPLPIHFTGSFPPVVRKRVPIRLSYHGGNHYNR